MKRFYQIMGRGRPFRLFTVSLFVLQAVAQPSEDWFVEAATGLTFVRFNGMTGEKYLPEITGGGAAILDYDQDGDWDVYLVQGALIGSKKRLDQAVVPWTGSTPPMDRLFRNDGGPDGLRWTDVTQQSGIRALGYGIGVAAGDVDNDGYPDLYVVNWGANQLWMNNGDGTFREVAGSAGVADPHFGSSAAFFDFDRDGFLDLFLANYVDLKPGKKRTCFAKSSAPDYCGPDAYDPVPDVLYRNKGDGTFQDVSRSSGIQGEYGAGLGVSTADFDGDGWIDLYVANDGDPNQLWLNQKNGTFRNEALLSGTALNREGKAEAGMGVDAADYDEDGDEDIFVVHLMEESNTLYLNLGQGLFEDATIEAGLHLPSLGLTAFGTGWFDYDNDGHLDLLTLNGAVRILEELARRGDPFPLAQRNQLFRNLGDGRFADVTAQAGSAFALTEVSRGAALGDLDNDGDLDVLIVNASGPARLLLNQVGQDRQWLGLRFVGAGGQDLLGTRVQVFLKDGRVKHRRAYSDGSYCSSRDPRVLVGLGDGAEVEKIRIYWPDGSVEERSAVQTGRYTAIRKKAVRDSEQSAGGR